MTVGKPHGETNVNEMSGHSAQPKHALRRDELRIIQMAARAPLDQFRQLLKDVLRTWSRRKGAGWNCSHSVGDNWTGSGSCTWNSTARCHDLNFLEEIVQSNGRHLKPNSLEDKRPQNLSALAREPLEPKWIRIYVCIIISIYIYMCTSIAAFQVEPSASETSPADGHSGARNY